MSNGLNQHFVPKFYFRLFTRGEKWIHLLRKGEDRISLEAPIKGECARHKFYGDPKIEHLFSKVEGQHSTVLRHLRDFAWQSSPPIRPADLARLHEAVLFQRSRTELEVEKNWPATQAFLLETFKEFVRRDPRIENPTMLLEEVEHGNIEFTQPTHERVALLIAAAIENAVLISDLDFHLLRNQTEYPFLFGDSPVVFCNTYYRNVTHRGVLGLTTPGLQIFFPLDSRTLLLMLDDQVYGGRSREPLIVDVHERCDVSQLNALQIHHSIDTVYFAEAGDRHYVSDLWDAHKHAVVPPKDRLEKRKGWLVNGKPVDEVLYQIFEPHLNIRLALSFIDCTPIPGSEYRFQRRSPELYQESKQKRHDRRSAAAKAKS